MKDSLFSYDDFFNLIVDEFEYSSGPWAAETLEFWNKCVGSCLLYMLTLLIGATSMINKIVLVPIQNLDQSIPVATVEGSKKQNLPSFELNELSAQQPPRCSYIPR